MALLPIITVTRVGAAVTFSSCAGGGDTVTPSALTWIEVKNTSGSSTTVTVAVPSGASGWSGVAYANDTFVVPITTGDVIYGPLHPQLFADPVTGLVTITYSQVSGLTIACFTLATP